MEELKFGQSEAGLTLETTLVLNKSLEEVFPFFADARNLELITPPNLNFRIVTPDEELSMREGLKIDYRIKLWGVPMKWQSEISAWDPPHLFVDEQRVGPYKKWVHEHSFHEENGKTVVQDYVTYQVPGGSLVAKFFVTPELNRIFSYRQKVMSAIFANSSAVLVNGRAGHGAAECEQTAHGSVN